MKLICAGFPKTGTKTLACALSLLGYKVYDFIENFWYLEAQWNKLFHQGGTKKDFQKMFEDVDVVIDLPGCFFCEEILEAFPDAKVILSYRDENDVEDWYKSHVNQLAVMNRNHLLQLIFAVTPSGRKMLNFMRNCGRVIFGIENTGHYLATNELLVKKAYRRHYTYIEQTVSSDKLLKFSCSQGWLPLCKFLGIPVPPNVLFPYKNVKGSYINEAVEEHPIIKKMKTELTVICLIVLAFFIFSIVFFLSYFLT